MQVPILRVPFPEEGRRFIHEGVDQILDSGGLTMGRQTARFEELFAEFSGTRYAIACTNGTAALELILRSLDIHEKTVLVPTNTFLATALAVLHSGNRVVFCDSDPETLCLDAEDARRRVTPDTAAIILVHIGGIITPAVRSLQELCRENGIFLIEDCAHAHGSSIDGQVAGSLGIAGAFSMFPTKVLTTGEGGMVTTSDEGLARRVRSLRNHGKNPDLGGKMSELGNNHRMSEITALIGVQQMRGAGRVIEQRRQVAAFYDSRVGKIQGLRPISIPAGVESTYYKYPVYFGETIDRDRLKRNMKEKHGVSLSGEVYADLCHTEPVWQRYTYCGRYRASAGGLCVRFPGCGCDSHPGPFPGAERISKRHVCLPLFPGLTEAELGHVVSSLETEVSSYSEGA